MSRDVTPAEIADLVNRAERVKRNREIILRTFNGRGAVRCGRQSVPLSPARRQQILERAFAAVSQVANTLGSIS